MKKFPHSLLLLFSLTLIFFACQKEYSSENNGNNNGNGTTPPTPVVTVKTSVQGRVIDEKQEPVKGAIVSFGAISGITDVNGFFKFDNVVASKNTAVVVVKKDGYFNGSRTFITSANSLKYVQIQLLPKKEAGQFEAVNGGQITAASTCQLTFQPNHVLNGNNEVYSGKVSVLISNINPEDSKFADIQPGALRGTNKNGKEVGLQSFGMFAVELQGANGEALHLDTNKSVMLKYAIPTSLLNTAPATMPLWYFDEKSGLWQEEGLATKNGAFYIGEVKHFSFWNLDYPFAQAKIKIRFLSKAGVPVQATQVILKTSEGQVGYGFTDDNGVVEGIVPAEKALTLSLAGQCNNTLYTHPQPIGPLLNDTDLGDLAIDINIPFLTITGKITDCDNAIVKGAYVSALLEGRTYRTYSDDNGKYSINILRCASTASELEIAAMDVVNNTSNKITKTVTVNTESIDLQVCKEATAFMNLNFNGKSYTFGEQDTIISWHMSFGTYSIGAKSSKADLSEQLNWGLSSNTPFAPGTYPLKNDNFFFRIKNMTYSKAEGTCTLTKVGTGADEFYEGSITGTLGSDSTGTTRFPITGTFKMKILYYD
ncbi:carboxypeptidase regulatory-like domain-containing protein [Chitinophaga silvatica]|uniref:Carboxypeptidase regulatory-like domain-containing protein n=1 Tax=Chitinophaga silvatica TaxID=2282649 RepID=A0A3E1YB31_9BACT|nr:carboxypeptidase-like regulatory domain-containing protein [Chitinophaga silvatica]RFS23287.1 carboxypeptidase regulatory-like domain-containing protein [Chitinophaga silvatica]